MLMYCTLGIQCVDLGLILTKINCFKICIWSVQMWQYIKLNLNYNCKRFTNIFHCNMTNIMQSLYNFLHTNVALLIFSIYTVKNDVICQFNFAGQSEQILSTTIFNIAMFVMTINIIVNNFGSNNHQVNHKYTLYMYLYWLDITEISYCINKSL